MIQLLTPILIEKPGTEADELGMCSLKATQLYGRPFGSPKVPVQPLDAHNSFLPNGKKIKVLLISSLGCGAGKTMVSLYRINVTILHHYYCSVKRDQIPKVN